MRDLFKCPYLEHLGGPHFDVAQALSAEELLDLVYLGIENARTKD